MWLTADRELKRLNALRLTRWSEIRIKAIASTGFENVCNLITVTCDKFRVNMNKF